MSHPAEDIDAMLAELAEHCADLAKAAHETACMLGELLAARAELNDPTPDGSEAAYASPLTVEVLEIAALQAQAAGVSVEQYLSEAVLAYDASPDGGSRDGDGDGGDLAVRRRDALKQTRRVRAESHAVTAQSAQMATHAAQRGARANAAARSAQKDGDSAEDSDSAD